MDLITPAISSCEKLYGSFLPGFVKVIIIILQIIIIGFGIFNIYKKFKYKSNNSLVLNIIIILFGIFIRTLLYLVLYSLNVQPSCFL